MATKRGPGRPPVANPADQVIKVRVTVKQKALLEKYAQEVDLSLSQYLVWCGLRQLRK